MGRLSAYGHAHCDLYDAGVPAGHLGGAGASLQHARHQNFVHPVCGANSWRAAYYRVVHGLVHAALVHARGREDRRAGACGGGHHAVFSGLHGRGHSRRLAGFA